MDFKHCFLCALFVEPWAIHLSKTNCGFVINNVERNVPLAEIVNIDVNSNLIFWKSLTLEINDKTYTFKGLSAKKARLIKCEIMHRVHTQAYEALRKVPGELKLSVNNIKLFLASFTYISYRDHRKWRDSLHPAVRGSLHPFFINAVLNGDEHDAFNVVFDFNNADNDALHKHNENFIEQVQSKCKHLFDHLEDFPLSEEQQRAIIINADRQLLIAAAGSGKSATLAAKAIYLIDQQLAKSEEILVLAYNKDAQQEIEERLRSRLKISPLYNTPVTAKTFHGLGLEIIKEQTRRKPSIAEIATTGKIRQLQLFNELVGSLLKTDKAFARNMAEYKALYQNQIRNLSSFSTKREYDDYLLEAGGRWRGPIGNSEIVLQTMDGNEVKSMEELQIANWLVINGIDYVYESSYEIDLSDYEHRQYMPDFYYPDANVYHEHFAIDKKGKPPAFFKDYAEGVKWKREIHKEFKTTLFETHSADFSDGSIYDVLENALLTYDIKPSPISTDALNSLICDSFNNDEYEIFLIFLRHFKMNNCTINSVLNNIKPSYNSARNRLFIKIFTEIYFAYQKMLEDRGQIDFEDQIHQASSFLEKNEFVHPYKYILVDEFQDLSQDRKRLILSLLGQSDDSYLFGVGDDWQSIYRFSGADIDLMVNFNKHFGQSVTSHLTKTYRSYQGIVDVASEFVMKNPKQIKKNVSALNNIDSKQVHIINVNGDQLAMIEAILDKIDITAKHNSTRLSVFLIGRYNFSSPKNIKALENKYTNISLLFKTVHKSKGLESDYVIILSVESGKYGFPSSIEDDPIINLVIPEPEQYLHAEERRLMYVALTRAKRGVYILSNTKKPSSFTHELSNNAQVEVR